MVLKHDDDQFDTSWSWVMAAVCSLQNLLSYGLFRAMGILFTTIVEEYGITREEASWPFSMSSSVLFISGIFVSILLRYFSIRGLTCFGTVLAASGVAFSYFAPNIIWLTLSLGVVQGFGLGITIITRPVLLNMYFKRHRGIAHGINLSGTNVGSFILPPVTAYLLQEYGLRGTFLILGGIILNALPISMLMRTPAPINQRQQGRADNNNFQANGKETTPSAKNEAIIDTGKSKEVSKITTQAASLRENSGRLDAHPEIESGTTETLNICTKEEEKSSNPNKSCQPSSKIPKESQNDVKNGSKESSKQQSFIRSGLHLFLETVKCRMFPVVSLTFIYSYWFALLYAMIIVDVGVDAGIPKEKSVFLMSAFSLADLIGRLGIGVIARNNVKRSRILITLALGCKTLSLILISFAHNFQLLTIASILLGFFLGCCIVMSTVLMVEYLGMEKFPIALGFTNFCGGLAALTRPLLTGWFRDNAGSYQGLFWLQACVAASCCLLWLVQPFICCRSNRDREAEDDKSCCETKL